MSGLEITRVRNSIYLVGTIDCAAARRPRRRRDASKYADPDADRVSNPLGDIATLEYTDEWPIIWRRGRLPTITVQADLAGTESVPVVRALDPQIKALRAKLPAVQHRGRRHRRGQRARRGVDHGGRPGHADDHADHSRGSLQSFQRVFLVVSVAPLGLIGVVAIMLATGTPMGFIATLGVIALIGIIIRNSVILIDQIEVNIAQGEQPWDAVVNATMHRVRPILLTAAAAMFGMIPIAFDVFWGPMAYAMIGGLAAATLLTLVFLPALYAA